MFPTYTFDPFYDRIAILDSTWRLTYSLAVSILRYSKYLISLCLFLYLCVVIESWITGIIWFKNDVVKRARKILNTLLVIVTPTQSIWPPRYAFLAYRVAASSSPDRVTIPIPLKMAYYDLVHGNMELRDPEVRLPMLFKDAMITSTVSLRLDVGLYWWAKLLGWLLCCGLLLDEHRPTIPASSQGSSGTDSPSPPSYADAVETRPDPGPPSLLYLSTLQANMPLVSLDCVPYHHLQSRIRRIQASLAPGECLMLGLTTRAGRMKSIFWNKATILAALPLLPRVYRRAQGREGPILQRTSTPLFASVVAVIQLLTSGPKPLTIEVIRNVSQDYAKYLHKYVQDLENEVNIRDSFVKECGRYGWNEERLCTMWEAALLDGGSLEGWTIVVRRPRRR